MLISIFSNNFANLLNLKFSLLSALSFSQHSFPCCTIFIFAWKNFLKFQKNRKILLPIRSSRFYLINWINFQRYPGRIVFLFDKFETRYMNIRVTWRIPLPVEREKFFTSNSAWNSIDPYERVITTFDNSTFIRFSLPRLIVIRHIYANGRAFNDHATFETINCSSVTFNFCVTGTTLSCIYPVSISNLISYLLALFFFNLSSSFSSSSSRSDSFRLIFNRTWFLFYFFFFSSHF